MNEMNRISDEMLMDVSGGTKNIKNGGKDESQRTTTAYCDNPKCKKNRTFNVYQAGRGTCSVCGTARYDL